MDQKALKEDYQKGHSVKFLKEKYNKKREDILIALSLPEIDDTKYARMLRHLHTIGYKSFFEYVNIHGALKTRIFSKEFNLKIK